MRWNLSRSRVYRILTVFGGVLVLLAAWAVVIEPGRLNVKRYRVEIPGVCAPIRIALLADLHVGSPFNRLSKLDRIIRSTVAERPDLVLLAGDYVVHGVVGGRFTSPEELVGQLGNLRAPLGVWAVLGNHDWWLDGPRVRRAFEGAGIRVLDNESARIDANACPFWLAGIGDYMEGKHDIGRTLSDVTDARPVVAVTHNPDVFPEVPPRVSLTLAGHTHGGQVYVPFIGRPIVPSRYGQRYAVGHIVEDGRHLVVSAGLGTSILPVRFLVPPEIVIVEVDGGARKPEL